MIKFKKPEQMLIYLSYPIMDVGTEPGYVSDLLKHIPDNWVLYRPLLPLADQLKNEVFSARLNYYMSKETKEKFALTKQTLPVVIEDATVLSIATQCSNYLPPTNCQASILKDLSILSISDLVISSTDRPCFGEYGMELLWANILDIPTICVSDRFLLSPWLQAFSDILIRNASILQELDIRGSSIDTRRKEFGYEYVIPKDDSTEEKDCDISEKPELTLVPYFFGAEDD